MLLHNPFRAEQVATACHQQTPTVSSTKFQRVGNAQHSPANGNNQRWNGNRRGNFRGRGRGGGRASRTFEPEPDTSKDFLCEACDRVFFSQSDFQEHLALHVRCPHCRFSSLQQLVDLHVKLVHDKHLASKVLEQSPEEIAEYLAERRRRFPRSRKDEEKIEDDDKKGAIHEENVRGNKKNKFDRQKTKTHGEESSKFNQRSRQRKRRRGRPNRNDTNGVSSPDLVQEGICGVPRFGGMPLDRTTNANDLTRTGGNISDNDDFHLTHCQSKPKPTSQALLQLIGTYTDSEDEILPKKITKNEHQETVGSVESCPLSQSTTQKTQKILESCRKDQNPDAEVRKTVNFLIDRVAAVDQRRRKLQKKQTPPVSHRKLSLLEKLLAKDIRHERNLLLQCVDYIVQMNFFDGQNFEV